MNDSKVYFVEYQNITKDIIKVSYQHLIEIQTMECHVLPHHPVCSLCLIYANLRSNKIAYLPKYLYFKCMEIYTVSSIDFVTLLN